MNLQPLFDLHLEIMKELNSLIMSDNEFENLKMCKCHTKRKITELMQKSVAGYSLLKTLFAAFDLSPMRFSHIRVDHIGLQK